MKELTVQALYRQHCSLMCVNNGPDRKFVIPDPADVQIRKKVQRHEEGRKLSFPWARDWSSAEGVTK